MSKSRILVGLGLATAGLLTACGESAESVSRNGVRVPHGVSDPGILQDPTTYNPTEPPTGGEAVAQARRVNEPQAAGSTASADIDVEGQAQQAVADFVAFLRDGELEMALRQFDPAHVSAVTASGADESMYNTLDALDQFSRSLRDKVDDERHLALLDQLRGLPSDVPAVEILDPQHASVTPNVAWMLFGPEKAGAGLKLVLLDGYWRFQLDAPLQEGDATTVVLFHDNYLGEIQKITDWVAAASQINQQALEDAIENVSEGKPSGIEAAEAAPAGPDRPTDQRVPSRGKGRRLRPPQ